MGYARAGEILKEGYKNGYAVPAFNVFNYETIKWAIMAAEKADKPILVEFYPGWKDFIPLETVATITKQLASRVKVPIGLHLDHCNSHDVIIEAIDAGFESVMYDGSSLPYQENLANTSAVAETAKSRGVDLEAELGHVGSGNVEDTRNQSMFTEPDMARDFLDKTGINSLAVAIGNGHGPYSQLPELDFDRLEAISKLLGIPLVLHGGSGIPDDQVQKAVKLGIAKMNIATDFHHCYYKKVESYMVGDKPHEHMYFCTGACESDVVDYLVSKINVLNNK